MGVLKTAQLQKDEVRKGIAQLALFRAARHSYFSTTGKLPAEVYYQFLSTSWTCKKGSPAYVKTHEIHTSTLNPCHQVIPINLDLPSRHLPCPLSPVPLPHFPLFAFPHPSPRSLLTRLAGESTWSRRLGKGRVPPGKMEDPRGKGEREVFWWEGCRRKGSSEKAYGVCRVFITTSTSFSFLKFPWLCGSMTSPSPYHIQRS